MRILIQLQNLQRSARSCRNTNFFCPKQQKLFLDRIHKGKIRDIHGDLHLKNVFIVQNRFYLYDRIEFNDALRYADIAEDVAHLSMDLDHHKRTNFQKYL